MMEKLRLEILFVVMVLVTPWLGAWYMLRDRKAVIQTMRELRAMKAQAKLEAQQEEKLRKMQNDALFQEIDEIYRRVSK